MDAHVCVDVVSRCRKEKFAHLCGKGARWKAACKWSAFVKSLFYSMGELACNCCARTHRGMNQQRLDWSMCSTAKAYGHQSCRHSRIIQHDTQHEHHADGLRDGPEHYAVPCSISGAK